MLLPKIAKLINIQNDFDKKNISIIEIGSKSNLETFISLLNNFNVNWLALVDRDFASKTESLALMKKLNDSFDYRLNIDATGEIDLIQQFKTKNIYVLEHGEIENYYSIIWLSGIITSEIEDLTLNPADEDYVKRNFDTINNTTVIGTFKQGFFTGKAFESYNQYVLNKLINIKFKLLTLNLDQNKVSKELELIFNEIDLSKPRIAIKLLPYMQIVDMPAHKRTDLEGFINKIFL